MISGTPNPPGRAGWRDAAGLSIAGIASDSRQVRPGFLFAALPGARGDGRDHIGAAVAKGAAAVLAPIGTIWPAGVPPRPLLEDEQPRRRLAQMAAAFAGAQPRTLVAVTGTNGKTSTVEFLRQMLGTTQPSASLGTLGVIVPTAPELARAGGLTTPDPVALAQTLAALARAGISAAAIEASSHGLDQFRLDGLRLRAAGFSNLTRDHLDYHPDMAAYRRAKLRLFAELLPPGAPAVVNADMDPETLGQLHQIAAARRLDLRSVGAAGTTLKLLDVTPGPDGQELRIAAAGGAVRTVHLGLPGRFQADNALLAAALAEAVGVADALALLPALQGVRGRLELAARLANGACAYVDYAHTPDALARLLQALRPHGRRLVLVFGAGGDRDAGKRPLMGAVAASGADVAIITDDNPRGESPVAIRAAIRAACPGAIEIGDRAQAIAAGLELLGPGDVLAVAGKGHEQGQIIGDQTLPFDDVAIIRALVGAA